MSEQLKGKFIVLDGGEGSGKSTQAALLRHALERRGCTVLSVRDPGATRIGELIRAILLNPEHTEMNMRCEMLLYMAARAQMMAEVIQPALNRGEVVISDRFISSTLAYQLDGDGLTAGEIRAVGDIAIHHRWPDLTIILDMPVEAARVKPKFTLFPDDPDAGVEKDRIEMRPPEYHAKVRQNYLKQAKDHHRRHCIIDARKPVDQVHAEILSAVEALS